MERYKSIFEQKLEEKYPELDLAAFDGDYDAALADYKSKFKSWQQKNIEKEIRIILGDLKNYLDKEGVEILGVDQDYWGSRQRISGFLIAIDSVRNLPRLLKKIKKLGYEWISYDDYSALIVEANYSEQKLKR